MGIDGISVWQLLLILLIFLVTLLAAPVRRDGGKATEAETPGAKAPEKEADDNDEEPPLGV